jgi:uncharacterized phiE125 gp8 family phage protein
MLTRLVEPAAEPLTVAEAKKQCNRDNDFTDDDGLFAALIAAARDYAEAQLERALMLQTWYQTLDAFPGPSLMGVPFGRAYSMPGHAILLERPPVLSITNIEYIDMGGALQTMPSTDYVDPTQGGTRRVDQLARITPVFGKIWPIPLPQIESVRITYTAGYSATASDAGRVPPGIKTWMRLRVATLYENREEVVVGTRVTVSPLPYVDSLLDPYRIRRAA